MTGDRRKRRARGGQGRARAGKAHVSLPHIRFAQASAPTTERLAHAAGDVDLHQPVEANGQAVIRTSDQCGFTRMSRRGILDGRQVDAGERFRQDWWHSGQVQRTTMVYSDAPRSSRPDVPMAVSERQAHIRQRLRKARAALGPRLEPLTLAILVDELDPADAGRKQFGRKDPSQARASAIEVLRIALDTLADHYGL